MTTRDIPVVSLRKSEAARALGVSDETFDRHVRPTLAAVRCGSTTLYPVEELQRWVREHAATPEATLDEARRPGRNVLRAAAGAKQ